MNLPAQATRNEAVYLPFFDRLARQNCARVLEPVIWVPYHDSYMDDQIKAIAKQVIEHGTSVVEKLAEYRDDLAKQKMIMAAALWMQKELGLYDASSEPRKPKPAKTSRPRLRDAQQ